MSTREGIRASISMSPQGKIFLKRSPHGEFMVYKDQLGTLEALIASCKTRDEAKEKISNFGSGYDIHHANVSDYVPRKYNPNTPRNVKSKPKTPPAEDRSMMMMSSSASPSLRIVMDSNDS